ncbi:MAG TPA: right-handed parallel beta-helix repeat-containing protein, partial [Lacipirellulaceae bacterium]|nr:right-handed parallel beta-helix repeat-containing protein [Lacipirellulaceae bacterium]
MRQPSIAQEHVGSRLFGPRHRGKQPPHRRRLRFEPLEHRHLLASLTVNSLSDIKLAGDGLVTLREAIIAANTNTATDLGQTGSGADTIEFAPGLAGTISLLFGEMQITESLTINGPGRDLVTIDAQQNSRIFNILVGFPVGVSHAIRGLTLTRGNATAEGGAIRSDSPALLLEQMAVRDSTATAGGGIYSQGVLKLNSSVISGNTATAQLGSGGGFFTRADATVTGSTISGNRSVGANGTGGGFFSTHTLTLTDSHVIYNHANSDGGGFWHVSRPPGFIHEGGHAIVTNSTITGNSARVGGGFRAGYATITGSTISDNQASAKGGGLYINFRRENQFEGLTLTNSTLSGNTAPIGGALHHRYSATVTDSTINGNTGGGIVFDPSGVQYSILFLQLRLNGSTVSNNTATGPG